MRSSTEVTRRAQRRARFRGATVALLVLALGGSAGAGPEAESAPESGPGTGFESVVPPPSGATYLLVSRVGSVFARTILRPPLEDPDAYSRAGAEGEGGLPTVFALGRVAPNPVAGRARIAYDLPVASRVRFEVLDIAGRIAHTLLDGPVAAGRHSLDWGGTDAAGRGLSPGIYFLRMDARAIAGAGGIRRVDKVLVLR
jgi:hypothetical protein